MTIQGLVEDILDYIDAVENWAKSAPDNHEKLVDTHLLFGSLVLLVDNLAWMVDNQAWLEGLV